MKAIALLVGLGCAPLASGAPFMDPTRPPAVRESMAAGTDARQGPRLESVLIAPDRRIAVVNGQQVVVGARIAEGEVVRITENEVVIRGADSEQTLKLMPDVGRTPAKMGRTK